MRLTCEDQNGPEKCRTRISGAEHMEEKYRRALAKTSFGATSSSRFLDSTEPSVWKCFQQLFPTTCLIIMYMGDILCICISSSSLTRPMFQTVHLCRV